MGNAMRSFPCLSPSGRRWSEFEMTSPTGSESRTPCFHANVSRHGTARKQRKLFEGLRGPKKDQVLFNGETERESGGFGPEWAGLRSGGSFF